MSGAPTGDGSAEDLFAPIAVPAPSARRHLGARIDLTVVPRSVWGWLVFAVVAAVVAALIDLEVLIGWGPLILAVPVSALVARSTIGGRR